jgi:hypothetical protein
MESDQDYEAISDRYADPATSATPIGAALTGATAAAAGRELLVREYGSIEAVDAEIRRGRRKIGDERRGESPVVRGRISDSDFEEFKELEVRTGKKQAELVREAVKLLLSEHRRAS